jgi:hypothetical protein
MISTKAEQGFGFRFAIYGISCELALEMAAAFRRIAANGPEYRFKLLFAVVALLSAVQATLPLGTSWRSSIAPSIT